MITFRMGTVDEVSTVVHHRHAMFTEMGRGTEEQLQKMDEAFAVWLQDAMRRGKYHAFFAKVDEDGEEHIIAGAGLWLIEWAPGPFDLGTERGYIANVYTEPEFRKRGVAQQLVEQCLEACRQRGLTFVTLHPSDAGAPIYAGIGFKESREMIINLHETK